LISRPSSAPLPGGTTLQASGRTATFTGPAGTGRADCRLRGPSVTRPPASARAENSIASPMKPATNSLFGCSYSCCGVPACAIRPAFITMIWSLTASASLWSCVT
jgi:hypothetical protein